MVVKKKRIPIPTSLRRELLVDSNHKCSIPNCPVVRDLEAHHINENPADNKKENIIMLCPNHHALASEGVIDRKACIIYKNILKQQSSLYPATQVLETLESIDTKLSGIMDQNQKGKTQSNGSKKTRKLRRVHK